MSRPSRPAQQIPVPHYRLLLQWPLFLDDGVKYIRQDDIARRVTSDCDALLAGGWTECDPARFDEVDLSPRHDRDCKHPRRPQPLAGDYQEFVFFHDFTQRFLYPKRVRSGDAPHCGPTLNEACNPSFRLFSKSRYTRMAATISGQLYEFEIDRLTLHLFPLGIAVMSLELALPEKKTRSGFKPPRPWETSLADVQRVIDLLRRTDVPYWTEGGESGTPNLVPDQVTLYHEKGCEDYAPYAHDKAIQFFEPDRDNTGAIMGEACPRKPKMILDHWKKLIAPLHLSADGGPWRDPSDERIPVSSYISVSAPPAVLKQGKQTNPNPDIAEARLLLERTEHDIHDLSAESGNETKEARADREKCLTKARDLRARLSAFLSRENWSDGNALLSITTNDWARLAEADGPGLRPVYNETFLKPLHERQFYDRYFPDGVTDKAVRYVFGGAHFAAVGAGEFFDNTLRMHWRRHYGQLSLIVRFETAALLALSSRLSQAVTAKFEAEDAAKGQDDFEDRILDIQKQFLAYVHRFHFTGVTSQIQGNEMHERWRESTGQDDLFDDVKSEIDTASAAVMADKQTREAEAATLLSRVALIGVVGGLAFGALGANVLVGVKDGASPLFSDLSEWKQLLFVLSAFLGIASGSILAFEKQKRHFQRRRFEWGFALVCGAAAAVCLVLGLFVP